MEIISTILKNKYYELLKLFDKMTQTDPNQRPNCREILELKHLWALDLNEFEIESELRIALDSETKNNNTNIFSIIESKLIKRNNEVIKSFQSINEKETFVMESMLRYKHRPVFVQKSLILLYYDFILIKCEPRPELIDLIVVLMREHSKIEQLQEITFACLYKLTEEGLGEKIDIKILEKVLNITIITLQLFPYNEKLQKIALLTLGSILLNHKISSEVSFDRYKCIQILIDSLVNSRDRDIYEMALEICSIISSQLSPNEKSDLLMKDVYLETFLTIITNYPYSLDYDFTLEYSLSTLTNLTDDSPKTCKILSEKWGIDIFLIILRVSID
jgi:Zyg-11 family protein